MAIIKKIKGVIPRWGKDCFIADNAAIIGDVVMGDECTVWFNTVVRGDVHYIRIGNRTNIQDGAIIHCTYQKAPTTIGNSVSIGHAAIIHGCTLQDSCLVGMGAIVMDHAVVESESLVAAGAVVTQNTVVEAGYLYAGVPARKIRPIDAELRKIFERTAGNYVMYSKWIED